MFRQTHLFVVYMEIDLRLMNILIYTCRSYSNIPNCWQPSLIFYLNRINITNMFTIKPNVKTTGCIRVRTKANDYDDFNSNFHLGQLKTYMLFFLILSLYALLQYILKTSLHVSLHFICKIYWHFQVTIT